METNFNRPSDAEESDITKDGMQAQANVEEVEAHANESQQPRKRIKHEDHNVSRKYKLFSNHSSYGDSPHTNTSI